MRLRRMLRGQLPALIAFLLLIVCAVLVGGYILAHQRLTYPSWAPIIGQKFFYLDAELSSAAGVLPGQGNAVTVSGVTIGEIADVRLRDARAVLRLRIEPRFAHVYPDATLLLRPKTGLKDMIVELDPGTKASGRELAENATLGVEATKPDVNFDEILSELDGDSRAYLVMLLGGAGTALGEGNGKNVAQVLRRFEPLSRHVAKATSLVAQRRTKLKRLMTNLRRLSEELGNRDKQLGTFVNASAATFRHFSAQQKSLGQTVDELPGTLATSRVALTKLDTLGSTLEVGLARLRPTAKRLGPSLEQVEPFLRKTLSPLRDELRPFARDAQPTAAKLVPIARELAAATPKLDRFTGVVNGAFDELAHDPPGNGPDGQSYLFYLPWASHNTNSVLAAQDAVGPTRRALILVSCGQLQVLRSLANPKRNPTLSTLIQLLNTPNYDGLIEQKKCPKPATEGAPLPTLTPQPAK